MPYEADDVSRYDLEIGWDGLHKVERVRIARALRSIEELWAERQLRAEVKRLEICGHSPKRIAKWLRVSIETVEEYLAA